MNLYDDVLALADRLLDAGWVLGYDRPVRPPDFRHHDEDALEALGELLEEPIPPFLRTFALDVGAVFLTGHIAPGSRLDQVLPGHTTPHTGASLPMLTTVPLPTGVHELQDRMEEDQPLGIPLVEDPDQAGGLSGGPPLCVLVDPATPLDLALYVDVDPEEPVGLDFPTYVRRCLSQGGLATLPEDEAAAALFRELGEGLGR
jgi:hypothetical protein